MNEDMLAPIFRRPQKKIKKDASQQKDAAIKDSEQSADSATENVEKKEAKKRGPYKKRAKAGDDATPSKKTPRKEKVTLAVAAPTQQQQKDAAVKESEQSADSATENVEKKEVKKRGPYKKRTKAGDDATPSKKTPWKEKVTLAAAAPTQSPAKKETTVELSSDEKASSEEPTIVKELITMRDASEITLADGASSGAHFAPPGTPITLPHFPLALMVTEFLYTRPMPFPAKYQPPTTDQLTAALSAEGPAERARLARRVTYPLARALLQLLVDDEKYAKRLSLCGVALSQLALDDDEDCTMELLRVIVSGEEEAPPVKRKSGRRKRASEEEEEEMPARIRMAELEEEREPLLHRLSEGARAALLSALDAAGGRWERMEGRSQGALIEFLLNSYLDSARFELPTEAELREQRTIATANVKRLKATLNGLRAKVARLRELADDPMGKAAAVRVAIMEARIEKSAAKIADKEGRIEKLTAEIGLARYGTRLAPLGVDREGRRYGLMPHYAGLLVQSMGGGEEGSEEEQEEEWRRIDTADEWAELSRRLKTGTECERALEEAMKAERERFERGVENKREADERRSASRSRVDVDEEEEEGSSERERVAQAMLARLERAEAAGMTASRLPVLRARTEEARTPDEMAAVLLECAEALLMSGADEGRTSVHRGSRGAKAEKTREGAERQYEWRSSVQRVTRWGELLLLMHVLDYRLERGWAEEEEEEESEGDEEDDESDEEDEEEESVRAEMARLNGKRKKKQKRGEDDVWIRVKEEEESDEDDYGPDEKRESRQQLEVRQLLQRVQKKASLELAATLLSLEGKDRKMWNLEKIRQRCKKYSRERLVRVLRANADRWRVEIEHRFLEQLCDFDEFAEELHEILK